MAEFTINLTVGQQTWLRKNWPMPDPEDSTATRGIVEYILLAAAEAVGPAEWKPGTWFKFTSKDLKRWGPCCITKQKLSSDGITRWEYSFLQDGCLEHTADREEFLNEWAEPCDPPEWAFPKKLG